MLVTTNIKGITNSFVKERIVKPLVIGSVISLSITAFCQRYTIIPSSSSFPCISGSIFLLDRQDMNIQDGNLVTFLTKNAKLFPDDTHFTKLVVGSGGDTIVINRNEITNAGKTWNTDVTLSAQVLHVTLDSLSRTETIKPGHLFTIGTLPGSYDSRFWGQVNIKKQVLGKTYVLI
ncbi:TPA: S26 family signal peptidase [Photobacterium damselae]|uniref:S26 family signal peptidase n=1 Tax=Photobacterium damselae TaxID=38293 RepID=UPI0015A0ACB2|nr:S26 family signal peptidase [Photobacterium damselae]NVO60216.1 S26 family signal peptidase [Photobacterium damselae subsp. damselae]